MSGDPRISSTTFHGGDLADAAALVRNQNSNNDWIDLSTGINPHPYPIPELAYDCWTRLPGRKEHDALLDAAYECYSAPSRHHIVAGPGSQAIIQALPSCLPQRAVSIVGPTYSGHEAAWAGAGCKVTVKPGLGECDPGGITIVTNPNNPDGRTQDPNTLEAFAKQADEANGWLIVDEAFCDLDPALSVANLVSKYPIIVLRSFGKFYGLAGLRLGFAIANENISERIAARLGPWAVNGPAITIAATALADRQWQKAMRNMLQKTAKRLGTLLESAGLPVTGGTDLYRFLSFPDAPALHTHLLGNGIYVRHFPENPDWLRIGLPGDEPSWNALQAALETFAR